jgi:hypothetical protein
VDNLTGPIAAAAPLLFEATLASRTRAPPLDDNPDAIEDGAHLRSDRQRRPHRARRSFAPSTSAGRLTPAARPASREHIPRGFPVPCIGDDQARASYPRHSPR